MQTKRFSSEDSIVEAAFELFSRDPSATLSEVAELAGVGRATLHRKYANREALVRALTLIAIEEMDTAVEEACGDAQSAGEVLRLALQALIPLGDRHGFMTSEPVVDAEIRSEFERIDSETLQMIEAAKAEGLFDAAVPSEWISQSFDALLYAAWESIKQGKSTSSQASDLAWRTLTRGLGA